MDKPTLNVDEAAEFLKCHPETVRELIRARKLVAVKVGRRFVIRRQLLDAYLEDKENDAVQASAQNRSRKICLNDKIARNRVSTNATVLGILTSGQKAAKELDALLARKTVKKPKHCANS